MTTQADMFAVTSEYRSLHKYLHDRYADCVVLTFAEIEDLLGFTLPDVARIDQAWWASGDRLALRDTF
jgi:hypothetical protein